MLMLIYVLSFCGTGMLPTLPLIAIFCLADLGLCLLGAILHELRVRDTV